MTYTFKLARRLAVSRTLGMLPALILFAACAADDTTSPENSPAQPVTSLVSIAPGKVTAETNQLIRFRATSSSLAGVRFAAPVVWSATGGTILPDGRFSAAVTGRYLVLGRSVQRRRAHIDTAVVEVVRHQPALFAVSIDPDSAVLTPGTSQVFSAVGALKGGAAVPVGVNWSATGGTIDAGGNFVAGDTAGTYRVIATDTRLTVSDTSIITITGPAPQPVPPEEPPALVLASVTLKPGSATLAPSVTRQFAAWGLTTNGDSVAVSVSFTATGGTVTDAGLYTAGATAGSYRVIATSGALSDTSAITVTQPLGSGPAAPGIAFGAFHLPVDSLNRSSLDYSGTTIVGYGDRLISDLNVVRARQGRVIVLIRRSQTKDANGLSVAATRAELATWPDISGYIADGTVIGVYVSDDILSDEWGPDAPYLSRIDSLAREVKLRWPTAITMVRAKPTELAGRSKWLWLETAWAQYRGPYRDPPPKAFADREVASAKAQGLGLVIWFNTLNGGCGPTTACLSGVPGTSIIGTYPNAAALRRYQMSAAETLNYGTAFLAEPYNCAAIAWQYSPVYKSGGLTPEHLATIHAYDSRPDVRTAMAQLAELAKKRTNTSCRQR